MRPEFALRDTTELNCMMWTLLYNCTCVSLHSSYLLLPSARMCVQVCVCVCHAPCERIAVWSRLIGVGPCQPVTKAGFSLGAAALRPTGPRQAPQLEHMRKLNRHPNSLPYTKQFKWYSLERWQVLMSLSLWQRGEGESHEETESGDGQLLFFFFFFSSPHQLFASSAPWALRRGGASTHSHLNKRGGWRWRCKELLCFFFSSHTCLHHHNPPFWILVLFRHCHTVSH